MAKRKSYTIKLNGVVVDTKHAWNTSKREIPKIISTKLEHGETARLIESHYKKNDANEHTFGVEKWESNKGVHFEFEIKYERGYKA